MNKMIKGLLVSVLAVSAAQVYAHDHTNHTFLMPRPTGVDLPMEYCTYEELINRKADHKSGTNYQVTGFYKDSTNGHDLAEFFLVKHKSTISIAQGRNAADALPDGTDVDLRFLIHDQAVNAQATGIGAKLSLDPEIDSYGARFDYHQDLDKILKGLYLKASMPAVCVETNVKAKTTGTDAYANTDLVKDDLLAYLSGNYYIPNGIANKNAQAALTNGLVTGKQTATGIADIDLALGYKFLNKHSYYASLALGFTIPTGNTAKGVYMFEPIFGNGQHFGLGGDLDVQGRVWGDCEHNLKINLFMKYRYLFESDEYRTLQLKNRPFSQYFLLGEVESVQAIPAANVLTQKVDVTPGSQFDGILGLAYNNGGFTLDIGYNLYYREREDIDYEGNFDENSYQVVARGYDMATANGFTLGVNGANVDGGTAATTWLKVSDINFRAAETPSQFTNSIYAGLGYYFKEWKTPVMFGLNGKYEFASENSAIEQWTIAGKIGIGF